MTNIALRYIQKDRVGRKRAIRQKSLSLLSPEKPSNPPKKQSLLQQTNNNGSNVMDFSLSQGSSLSLPYQLDRHDQNANFDSSFNQSLPIIPNFFNTENNQIYCKSLKNIANTPVVTLLRLGDARVSVCYGCSHNFKLNSITPNPPFDLVVVVKMRREFRQNVLKQFSAPSNTYFHVVHNNPFYTPSECIASRFLNFNVNHVKIHYDTLFLFSDIHKAAIRDIHVSVPM